MPEEEKVEGAEAPVEAPVEGGEAPAPEAPAEAVAE